MAGLLDSGVMKLLFGGSQHMKDREAARQGEAYSKLVGTPKELMAQTHGMPQEDMASGGLLPGGEGEKSFYGGTGLMGEQMTRPQFNAAIGAIPQYRDMSTRLQQQEMANSAAWDRSEADIAAQMDRYMTMSPYQRQQAGIQQQTANNQLVSQLGDDYRKMNEKYAPSIQANNDVTSLVSSRGNDYARLDGADRNFVLSSFLKALRPNEAQNEGDIANLKAAFGYKGTVESFWSSLGTLWDSGGGDLDDGKIKAMVEFMAKKGAMDSGAMERMQSDIANAYQGINMDQITWGSPQTYSRPAAQPQAPKAKWTPPAGYKRIR